jgi:hypothetical protein
VTLYGCTMELAAMMETACPLKPSVTGMVYPEREYDSWRQQQCASCKLLAGIKAWTAIAILCHRPLLYTFLKLLIADYPCSGPHLCSKFSRAQFLDCETVIAVKWKEASTDSFD